MRTSGILYTRMVVQTYDVNDMNGFFFFLQARILMFIAFTLERFERQG